MRKEIYLGYGLYKYVDVKDVSPKGEVEWKIVELENGGFIRRPFEIQTESLRMQDELEPIYHPTEYDESDDIEFLKKYEEVPRPAVTKRQVLEGPEAILSIVTISKDNKRLIEEAEKNFLKGEKWEWKNDT